MGFFIWSIFINKLNVMSIDKIKDRIRMIEENNFEINEINRTELSQHDINTLLQMNPSKASAILRSAGYADTAYNNIKNIASTHFKKSSSVMIGDEVELPNKDVNFVTNILRIFNSVNLLPNDYDKRSYKPRKNKYRINNNTISSLFNYDVRLEYDDERLTNLEYMYVYLHHGVTTLSDPEVINIMRVLHNNQINAQPNIDNGRVYIKIIV